MKICIIIPTYNEANKIESVIQNINKNKVDVLVVDDGSKDNTATLAKNAGANVLKNEKNQGKGSALAKGFSYALKNGYDAVITMDGDGQHSPDDIKFFLESASNNPEAHLFLGNRMHSAKNMPLVRWITNIFMSMVISCVAGQKVNDSQCGFRLIRKEVLQNLRLKSAKYEIESEMLIKASRAGFKIVPVNIQSIYRGEKSQINPFIDTLRFIRFILGQIWISNH